MRTVGRPLLPTRTSASASRCSNRTSIVGNSIPTLHQQTHANRQTPCGQGCHGHHGTSTETRAAHAPVDAFLELEKEALVVLVGNAHESLQQRPALARAEAEDVHHLRAPSVVEREDGVADAVAGGKPLERGPPQRLLVVFLIPTPRRRARERVAAAPPNGPGPGTAVAPPHACHLLDLRRRVHPCYPAVGVAGCRAPRRAELTPSNPAAKPRVVEVISAEVYMNSARTPRAYVRLARERRRRQRRAFKLPDQTLAIPVFNC